MVILRISLTIVQLFGLVIEWPLIYVNNLSPSMELIPLDFLWQVDEADELERVVTKGRAGGSFFRGERFRKLGLATFFSFFGSKNWSSCRKSGKYSRLVKYDEIHP